MNQKITLPALIALLAMKSGESKEKSENFIANFFSLISETLQEGESVKIKGLGTFKVIPVENRKSVNISDGTDFTIPGHNKVVFIPAREIAEKINAPFSMFDSVELFSEEVMESNVKINEQEEEIDLTEDLKEKELSPEEIQSEQTEDDPALMHARTQEPEILEEVITEKTMSGNTIPEDTLSENTLPEETISGEAESVENDATEGEGEEVSGEVGEYLQIEESEPTKKRKGGAFRFLMGFACGLAAAIVVLLGGYYFFLRDYLRVKTTSEQPEPQVSLTQVINVQAEEKDSTETNDSILVEEIPATEPSQMVVYDTIGRQRYLTTMAQDHYGSFNLWPYIYEENKSFLGHPDRIKPGTRVVIPNLKKYGVDPGNPKDIQTAKAKGVEIYNRYR